MAAAVTLYRSTIGKKVVMAVSGLILVGFVIAHMFGNLKIYEGPEKFNTYGLFLRSVGAPLFGSEQLLWIARLVLIAAVVLHMLMAWQLVQRNNAGRQTRYAKNKHVQASYASLTMRWGGVIILLFIVWHILDLTLGAVHPNYIHGDVYNNVIVSFSNPIVSGFYIISMLALGLHLYHGVWSMFQSLGLNSRTYSQLLRWVAIIITAAVVIGNISIPVSVLTGILHL
jgi:succinate dehydrogenase / fumarate reductase, cytochrome b subunit